MKAQAAKPYPYVPSDPHFARSLEYVAALGFEKEMAGPRACGTALRRRVPPASRHRPAEGCPGSRTRLWFTPGPDRQKAATRASIAEHQQEEDGRQCCS
jgi:hypothetical protein